MNQRRQQSLPAPIIYSDPITARVRFAELRLTPEELWAGFNFGLGERRNLTANDPPWLWGILTSGKVTRGLRDQLVQNGWTIANYLNYATVVHPDGLLQIAVSSADGDAGNPYGNPSTRAEKGIATELAVQVNQAGFHSILPDDFPAPKRRMPTYLFLYHVDDIVSQASAELALPIGISEDGLIREWQERIPLFPLDLDGGQRLRDGTEDGGEDIHIEVERRAS